MLGGDLPGELVGLAPQVQGDALDSAPLTPGRGGHRDHGQARQFTGGQEQGRGAVTLRGVDLVGAAGFASREGLGDEVGGSAHPRGAI